MTYDEIYNEICNHLWPGTTAPVNMVAIIRQKMKSCHRMINRNYNFWFTLSTYDITTVVGQRSYALPADFKEIERAFFQKHLQTFYGPNLEQLDLTDHLDKGMCLSNARTEYPDKMRVDGTNLDLYPLPSEIRTLRIYYWRFLPVLNIATLNAFTPATDAISEYCDEAMIYYVTSVVKLMEDEWQSSEIFKGLYIEALEGAMQEDKARRAMPENKAE